MRFQYVYYFQNLKNTSLKIVRKIIYYKSILKIVIFILYRFKTRNTYKRHLKTRHGKVLTINGELLHLSEEDSKKVRTKNRRKKQQDNITSDHSQANGTSSVLSSEDFTIPDPNQTAVAYCYENGEEANVEQVIENGLWMYNSVTEDVVAADGEEYNNMLNAANQVQMKTDIVYDETELENNYENDDQIIVAHADADGNVLHLKDYEEYSHEAVYEEATHDSGEFILPEEDVEVIYCRAIVFYLILTYF